jgi:hypothetical protein
VSPQRQIAALFAGVAVVLVFSAATARADDGVGDPLNALMMGGTAMPTPSEFWQDTIITDYIDPATSQSYTPVLVPTPESAASTSIPVGLANLQTIMEQQPAGQPYLIEGFSQSAQIAIDEKLELIASGGPPPDVTFLLLGSGNGPTAAFWSASPDSSSPARQASTSTAPSRPTPASPPSTSPTSTTATPTSRNIRSMWRLTSTPCWVSFISTPATETARCHIPFRRSGHRPTRCPDPMSANTCLAQRVSSGRSTATPRSISSPPPTCRCSTRCAAWACRSRC